MFWDADEAEGVNIKTAKPQDLGKIHANEAISAFGSTDTALTLNAENLAKASRADGRRESSISSQPKSPGMNSAGKGFGDSISSISTEGHRRLQDHQKSLPRLPVPSLNHTCDLYLKSLEGILNAEEFELSQQHVEEFRKPGGVGEKLQELLLKRNNDESTVSWFEDFWDDAYLCARDPIPININYFFGIEQHPKQECMTQIGRAGSLLYAATDIYCKTRDGDLTTDKERGNPLCMSQYRRVFCASRVPGQTRDSIVTFTTAPLCESDKISNTSGYEFIQPKHAVVLMRNRMFHFDVLSPSSKPDQPPLPISQEEITKRIAHIVNECSRPDSKGGPPVGVFTTLHRTEWFEIHENLKTLGKNEHNMNIIQSAIMVVCLDNTTCDDLSEAARLFLHGTGTNRWFDRHNLIVTKNGWAGINFEHSVGDGATTLRVADTMFRHDAKACPTAAQVEAMLSDVTQNSVTKSAMAREVKELDWTLDMPLDRAMKTAFDEFVALIKSNETAVLHFDAFGGNFIKHSKMSPDAFVQLAFQLAYYKCFGRNDATYEAASTRAFLHGRTEVVRSVSRSVVDFCQSTNSPLFSRRIGSKIPSQLDLMRDAITEHVDFMKKAKAAMGVDRHLLGLRLVCAEANIPSPPIFQDTAFTKASHWNLSTSHCGSSALNLFGFGPVVFDGFGLGYMIKNDSIDVVVTSKYTHQVTSSSIFGDMLNSALLQMKCIVDCDHAKRKENRGVSRTLMFNHPTALADFEYESSKGFCYKTAKVGKSLYSPGGGRSLIGESSMFNESSKDDDVWSF